MKEQSRMYLSTLLEEVFQDEEIPITLLRKYDLEAVLERAVVSIDKILSHSPVSTTRLAGLAPSILFLINNRLSKVTDPIDKGNLEFLMAEVTVHLLKKLLEKSDQPSTALKEIKNSLETASNVSDYNFAALLAILKYNSLENHYKEDDTYYYDWTGKPHELDELTSKLRRQGVIKSVKVFKQLFRDHGNTSLTVHINRESVHPMIALFDELKKRGLIISRGGAGHFHPLKVYGVDFENKVLMKNEPKSIKKNAKKKPEIWGKTENWAKELINSVVVSTTSKPPQVDRSKIAQVDT